MRRPRGSVRSKEWARYQRYCEMRGCYESYTHAAWVFVRTGTPEALKELEKQRKRLRQKGATFLREVEARGVAGPEQVAELRRLLLL